MTMLAKCPPSAADLRRVTVDVGADICGEQNGDSGSDDVKSADATRAPLNRLLAAVPDRLGRAAHPA
jgi:hypothetical protein